MPVNQNLISILPDESVLNSCIHCGLCLSVCPTYELTKNERSSPRGRIRLIKSAAEGEINISSLFAEEMEFCLDCQACMTACPAGVNYGIMVESARVEVKNHGYYSFLKQFILKWVIPNSFLLNAVAKILYLYQASGLQTLIRAIRVLKIISPSLYEKEKLTPVMKYSSGKALLKRAFGSGEVLLPLNELKYKTAFHKGCIMDVMFGEINLETVEALQKTNCSVFTPEKQVCCGSLQAHNGDFDTARELAKKNIDAFEKQDYDFLISNSAGCGAFMKEYKLFLKDDIEYKERAKSFSNKVKDITEFFASRNDIVYKECRKEVTYHDACHLVHSQKVSEEPRSIFSKIPGLKVIQLEEASWCCGSAGIYNLTRHKDSMKILERKMENIKKTSAQTVVMGNPGCIAQIKYGAAKESLDIEVLHTVQLLNKSI